MADDFKTSEMFRRELSRMEAAMAAQVEWLKDWHVSVLAPDPSQPPAAIGPTPFRAWYYGLPSDLFAESMAFAVLGMNLETMQTLAEQLANTVRQNAGKLPPAEYAHFMDAVGKFNQGVFKLIRECVSEIAFIDDLTGVGNENGMKLHIAAELERVRRTNQRCCVALVEIGNFRLADGDHSGGYAINLNEVMAAFASLLGGKLRPYDQLFRMGQEHFMLALPYTESDVAEAVLKRLAGTLTGGRLKLIDETLIDLDIRFGLASIEPNDTVDTVIENAYSALDQTRGPKPTMIATYRHY
ncbi:MAG: diguanylate cyclase [Rhodospirillales bacterium]|nr:diguanylate cyclase [Rhodospirillales bacterium]